MKLDLETTSIRKKIGTQGIQNWADVGLSIFQASVAKDSESIIQAIKTLNNAIPYLGPILNVLLDMLPSSNGFEEIKEEFRKMDSHLFAIENKIDALSEHVTYTNILSYYKSKAESIDVIQNSYQRYIYAITDITTLELIDKCKQNSMINYIYYVKKELTGSTTLPLMTVMKDNNNLANFQYWMKMLVGSISQSMMLHTICMSVQYRNNTGFNETISADISYFKNLSDIMLKVVKDGTNDIKRDFFETAKTEIMAYATANMLMDHSVFSQKVWEMLVKKYFWRHWFVASYDEEKYGEGNHYVTSTNQYVYIWFRMVLRNVHVVHTNNNDYSIAEKLRTCMEKKEWSIAEVTWHSSDMCKWVYEYVHPCIGGQNSLGVIKFRTEFGSYWSNGIAGIYKVYSPNYHGFRVFAVAPEK